MTFTGTARFKVLGKLGRGGMGDVYQVYDTRRGMSVALKHLRRVDGMGLYRFKREFRSLSSLSHPNIINLYELISEGDEWYFTMELVEGQDLLTYVRGGRSLAAGIEGSSSRASTHDLTTATLVEVPQPGPRGGEPTDDSGAITLASAPAARVSEGPALPAPPRHRQALADIADIERLRDALGQLARALDALHAADMIHRDLKPSNVRVTGEGRVVLMDFGVVVEARQPVDMERHGTTIGTPAFMAPEQVSSSSRPTAAADWYAFGVLLYLALAERLPYEGSLLQVLETKRTHDPLRPSTFTEGIPPDLERLCMALLSRDPAQRPSGAEILSRLGAGAGLRLPVLTEPTLDLSGRPFVGRARELATLREVFAEVCAGHARLAVIEGPSGMGKSSLADRFLREVRTDAGPQDTAEAGAAEASAADTSPLRTQPPDSRPIILTGRCHERETLPYKGFDSVVDALAGALIALPEEQRAPLLPPDLELLERLFPVLRRLSGGGDARGGRADMGALELRRRAFGALRALLGALARERPVVLHIEDLQWADVESLDLLRALLEPPAPAGLLVLATVRTHADGAGGGDELATQVGDGAARLMDELVALTGCRRIRVGPLSDAEQRELVTRLLRRRASRPEIDDELWRDASGNPMLVVELALIVVEEAPEERARAGVLRLEDILRRRVARLPAPVQALMEAVAVAGTPMPLRVLGEGAGLSSADAERAAALLRISQLVHTFQSGHEPWIGAYHDKVREAIAASVDQARARALHRRLAETLDAWGQAAPALMARHWQAADELERAAVCFIEAARQAAHKLAFDRAGSFYDQALALLPEPPGDRRVAALRCRAWLGLAEDMRIIDRTDEALEVLARAEPLAAAHGLDDELARLYYLRGNLLFPRGDLDGCLAAHEQARAFAEKAGSPEREARALSGLGDAHYMRGRMISAYEHFDRCIALCRAHGLVDIEVANLGMRGMTRYYQNDLGAALRDSTDAATAASWVGHQRAEIVARNGCIGWILAEMGRLSEARRELETALDMAQALGARRFEPNSLTWLAKIAVLEGRRGEAEDLARRSLSVCRETGFAFVGPMALGALALATDDDETRSWAIAEAEAALRDGGASHNHLYFYRDAMDALLAVGDAAGVERMAAALEGYTSAEPLPWSGFFVARARALAAWERGDRDPVTLAELERLRDEARTIGFFTAARVLDEALADAGSETGAGADE